MRKPLSLVGMFKIREVLGVAIEKQLVLLSLESLDGLMSQDSKVAGVEWIGGVGVGQERDGLPFVGVEGQLGSSWSWGG